MKHTTHNRGNATHIFIGIVALVALGLAWWAFNRSGENLTSEIGDATQEVVDETRQAANEAEEALDIRVTEAELAAARAEAYADLLALKAELEAEENYAEVLAETQAIEDDLDALYANASAEAQQEWAEMQVEFDQFENQLRSETSDALDGLGGLILLLSADVRTDEEENNTPE